MAVQNSIRNASCPRELFFASENNSGEILMRKLVLALAALAGIGLAVPYVVPANAAVIVVDHHHHHWHHHHDDAIVVHH
jgi:hypothetical protein